MSYQYSSQIQSEYGLSGPLSFELVHDGPDNQVFVVVDAKNNKYALRASKREEKDVSFEVDVLVALASANFSSPRPLKAVGGRYSIIVNNTQIVLFTYIQGWQVEKLEPQHLTTDLIERGASKLGELHCLTKEMVVVTPATRTIFTEYDRLFLLDINFLKQFKDYETFLDQANFFYRQAKLKIEGAQELYGVIHNDYRIQNLIYTNNDCFIIDFDWVCQGPLLKDLGLAIAEWSLYTRSTGPSKEAVDKFLDGYNKTAPQTVSYNKDLLFWICFACLSDACTFFVDVTQGRYADKNITDVDQCYMYRKFKYFHQELNK